MRVKDQKNGIRIIKCLLKKRIRFWREQNRDKLNARKSERLKNDPDWAKQYRDKVNVRARERYKSETSSSKRWHNEHPENVKKARDKYRENNPIRSRQWDRENKERKKETEKLWGINNPDKLSIVRARGKSKRRSIDKEVENTLTAQEWCIILKNQDNKCNYPGCGRIFTKENKPTKDHIVPLNPRDGSKGKGLTFENTQAVCRGCNSKKSNIKHPSLIQSWF